MKKVICITFVVCTMLTMSSCSEWLKSDKDDPMERRRFAGVAKYAAAPGVVGAMMEDAASPSPPAQQAAELSERKLMRRASLEIEVKDLSGAMDKTKIIVKDAGGFVENSSSYEDDAGQKALSLSLRVPAKKLDETLAEIKKIGRVKEESVGAEDVTEQYIDLEARLKNAQRLEGRLLDLLEKRSGKLKDVLDTERELARVRTDIETMQGRKRFMDNRIDLSIVSVIFTEPRGFGLGIFAPLSGCIQKALSAFTGSLAALIIVVSGLIPWIALIIFIMWLGIKLLRIRKRRKKNQETGKKEQIPHMNDQ